MSVSSSEDSAHYSTLTTPHTYWTVRVMAHVDGTSALRPRQELAGRRFGRLTVEEAVGLAADRRVVWRCRCDCGGSCEATSTSLLTGKRQSCGCLRRETLIRRNMLQAVRRSEQVPCLVAAIEAIRLRYGLSSRVLPWPPSPAYLVSDCGRVFTTKNRHRQPAELSCRLSTGGYLIAPVRVVGESRTHCPVHRLVLMTFSGPPPAPNAHGRHLDGNPLNNHIANLEWGTAADNMRDMMRHDRTTKGVRSPHAKLTDEIVMAIKRRLASGSGSKATAKEFGVSRSLIRHIRDGRSWAHVTAGLPPLG